MAHGDFERAAAGAIAIGVAALAIIGGVGAGLICYALFGTGTIATTVIGVVVSVGLFAEMVRRLN